MSQTFSLSVLQTSPQVTVPHISYRVTNEFCLSVTNRSSVTLPLTSSQSQWHKHVLNYSVTNKFHIIVSQTNSESQCHEQVPNHTDTNKFSIAASQTNSPQKTVPQTSTHSWHRKQVPNRRNISANRRSYHTRITFRHEVTDVLSQADQCYIDMINVTGR